MPRPKRPEEEHHQKISISFSPEHLQAILDYCQRNERSMAWVVRKALDEWLPKHKDDHV